MLGHTLAGASSSNEFRGSFTRLRLFDVPLSAFQQNVSAALGLADAPADPFTFGLPYFFLADFSTVTDDPTLPQVQRDNTWGLSDTYSLVHGRHTLKAGFNWIHFQFNYRQSNSVRGQYTYSGVYSGNGVDPAGGDALADFLLGFPESTQRSVGDSQGYLRQNDYGTFVQDEWQATSRLTFTVGLRYEYSSPFTEARDKLINLDYSNLPAPPTLVNVGSADLPNRTDFAPRGAIAWRLPGDTVFHAGYGVYFTPELAIEAYDLVLTDAEPGEQHRWNDVAYIDHGQRVPHHRQHRLPQLLRRRPASADAVSAAVERRLRARVARRHPVRGVLYREQGGPIRAVPPLQHGAAYGNRPKPATAAGRSPVAPDISGFGHAVPVRAHCEFVLQFASLPGGKAFAKVAIVPGQFRVVQIA